MQKIILSCENGQELKDLASIAETLEVDFNCEVYYFDIVPLLIGGEVSRGESALFKRQWSAKGVRGRPFKAMPAWMKLLTSLINAFYLVYIYYTQRASVLLVGTPLLTYRLARIMTFGNLRLVTYIRGVIAYSDENTSLSSRVFVRLGGLMRLRILSSVLSDYYADLVICVGEVTARFIASRGVPEENIRVVGSVYCDGLSAHEGQEGEKTVVFVSSAFAFHGYEDAQQAQTALIKSVREYVHAHHPQVRFIVRRHPREEVYYYDAELVKYLDVGVGDPLITYPSNTLFISPISTLIFEMAYAGRQGCIVADEFFERRFDAWYKSVGLVPVFDWRDAVDKYFLQGVALQQNFSQAISVKNKGRVVLEVALNVVGA